MKAYSFIKTAKTEEIHIFEGDFTTNGCNAKNICICKKVQQSEGTWIVGSICLEQQQARERAASMGRPVCGDCVSHLYTTYEVKYEQTT